MSDTTKNDDALPTAPSADAPKQTYHASCHCGAFAYDVTASPPLSDPSCEVMECNCSICTRNGYLLIYAANESIKFTKGDVSEFQVYRFNSKRMAHYFCGSCGATCMARSTDPEFFAGITCVNVRMFEDVDLKALKYKAGNGKNY